MAWEGLLKAVWYSVLGESTIGTDNCYRTLRFWSNLSVLKSPPMLKKYILIKKGYLKRKWRNSDYWVTFIKTEINKNCCDTNLRRMCFSRIFYKISLTFIFIGIHHWKKVASYVSKSRVSLVMFFSLRFPCLLILGNGNGFF